MRAMPTPTADSRRRIDDDEIKHFAQPRQHRVDDHTIGEIDEEETLVRKDRDIERVHSLSDARARVVACMLQEQRCAALDVAIGGIRADETNVRVPCGGEPGSQLGCDAAFGRAHAGVRNPHADTERSAGSAHPRPHLKGRSGVCTFE
jgi:hypothetical protein